MSLKEWLHGFGSPPAPTGGTPHAQQGEADRRLLADIRVKAEQGDAQAQNGLGEAFHFGKLGVVADEVEAVNWYRKAAAQNLVEAQHALGFIYKLGEGVAKDYVEAVEWWRKAAEQNHAGAQFSLGDRHAFGQGVTKDEAEAVKWYRRAAEQNFAPAQMNLGVCYHNGNGVAKDEVEAVKWYRRAAEQNHAQAQHNLGFCYADGQGVAKDEAEAYKWLLLAAAQGVKHATNGITIVEGMLTQDQLLEGQVLARNFKPREVPSAGDHIPGIDTAQIRRESSGTGFFITEDGYLITNEHVAREGVQVRLVTEAGIISATVVKVDATNDLALLKAEGKFGILPLVPSRGVRLGATVVTFGFPTIGLQGFAPRLAKGEITGLAGAQDDPRHFQISAPIQSGNSGGAMVDERGNVIGVVVSKLGQRAVLATTGTREESVSYAVKSSYLLSFLDSVPLVVAEVKDSNARDQRFEDIVNDARQATALVLVY